MVRPKGIKQALYIASLTEALGWKKQYQKTRDILRHAKIHPYIDHEKDALKLFIGLGHDLVNYQPFEEEAKAFHAQHYGNAKQHTSLVVTQQSIFDLDTPDQPIAQVDPDQSTSPRPEALVTRLAKLITHVKHVPYRAQIVRNMLVQGGYPKPEGGRWDDEARALRILQQNGISIEGFEYADGRPEYKAPAHLPSNIPAMSPAEMRAELVRASEHVDELSRQLREAQYTLKSVNHLDFAIKMIYQELDMRRSTDPDARLTDGEIYADLAYRQFLKQEK